MLRSISLNAIRASTAQRQPGAQFGRARQTLGIFRRRPHILVTMAANAPPTLLRLSLARAALSSSSRTRPFTTSRAAAATAATTALLSSKFSPFSARLKTIPTPPPKRTLHTTPLSQSPSSTKSHTGEPVPSTPPPTDFAEMDVLASAPVPSTAVDACLPDGFALNSGVRITGGDGALLVNGEAFAWRPWEGKKGLVNEKGLWEVGEEDFGVLGLMWPRPDLLILGLGPTMRPLSPAARRAITNLGMRVEVLDTRNAASQYNMLATERGVEDVAAALVPIGWKEGGK